MNGAEVPEYVYVQRWAIEALLRTVEMDGLLRADLVAALEDADDVKASEVVRRAWTREAK